MTSQVVVIDKHGRPVVENALYSCSGAGTPFIVTGLMSSNATQFLAGWAETEILALDWAGPVPDSYEPPRIGGIPVCAGDRFLYDDGTDRMYGNVLRIDLAGSRLHDTDGGWWALSSLEHCTLVRFTGQTEDINSAKGEWVQDDRTFRHTSGALIRAVVGGWYWWSAADARADVEFKPSAKVQTRAEAERLAMGVAAEPGDDGPGEGWVRDGNGWAHQASGARVSEWRAGWRWAANATAEYSSMAHSRREAERLAIAMAMGENDGSREGWTLRSGHASTYDHTSGAIVYKSFTTETWFWVGVRGGAVGTPVPTRREAQRLAIAAATGKRSTALSDVVSGAKPLPGTLTYVGPEHARPRDTVPTPAPAIVLPARILAASGAALDAIGHDELHTVRAGVDDSDDEFREQLLRALWLRGPEQATAFLLALERLVRAGRYRGNVPVERRRR